MVAGEDFAAPRLNFRNEEVFRAGCSSLMMHFAIKLGACRRRHCQDRAMERTEADCGGPEWMRGHRQPEILASADDQNRQLALAATVQTTS